MHWKTLWFGFGISIASRTEDLDQIFFQLCQIVPSRQSVNRRRDYLTGLDQYFVIFFYLGSNLNNYLAKLIAFSFFVCQMAIMFPAGTLTLQGVRKDKCVQTKIIHPKSYSDFIIFDWLSIICITFEWNEFALIIQFSNDLMKFRINFIKSFKSPRIPKNQSVPKKMIIPAHH